MIIIFITDKAYKDYLWHCPNSCRKHNYNKNEIQFIILRHYLLGEIVFIDKFGNHHVISHNIKLKCNKDSILSIEKLNKPSQFKHISEQLKKQFDSELKEEILSILREKIS